MGLSSILTSSSSLGGVTGRGKPPNDGFCVSVVLELVPKVKIPELDAPWVGSPNCVAVGFSGEVEGAPNLKLNENPGFVSFDASLCTTTGSLADPPGDGAGAGSMLNCFEPSEETVAPNPANGIPDELPNENIDDVDPFCSELIVVCLGSIVGPTEGADTFVGSGLGLLDVKSPNKPSGG